MTTISQNQGIYEQQVAKPIEKQPQIPAPEDITVPPPSDSEGGSNYLMNTLTGLALICSAAYIGHNFFKGRGANFEQTVQAFKQKGGYFEKGIAKLQDGSLYTGVLKRKSDITGNEFFGRYVNGRIVRSGQNVDDLGFYNPEKASAVLKNWKYNSEGKLEGITRTSIVNGNPVVNDVVRKNVVKYEDFIAKGGKLEKGIALNADGSKFKGYIVEYKGNNTVIKEFSDEGKQVSERLNTTIQDRLYKDRTEHYIMNETDLANRAKEQEKFLYKAKMWFNNLCSKFHKTKPEQA